MPTRFILQGFTADTHVQAVKTVLETPEIEEIIFSIAFVNNDGVRLIEEALRPFVDRAKFFVGIRNDITSLQGLERLIDLGVTLYVVDTGARTVIFHPKLYFAKGPNEARMVIGSANLTIGGLNNNIESSLALTLDLNITADHDIVLNVQDQLLDLMTCDPEHIFLVNTKEELAHLQSSGRLLDESKTSSPHPVTARSVDDTITRIQLRTTPLRREIVAATIIPQNQNIENVPVQPASNLELVWDSKPLTERDLNIPQAAQTHRTGSINLDKGLLDTHIDHRHYFRDVVFSHLIWTPSPTGNVEESSATFQLIIKGVYCGELALDIHHSTDTTSTTYRQRNAMTRLSWGPFSEYIARTNLIGRTLSLYRDMNDSNRFVLEID
ncbi:hypothetical protein A3K24_00715 [candidate division Kazan bacterium RIFCSPHIGHO2_01_FULL_44_14]|uniref:Phospholipase D-like domain-containing protein n=1 Tax=candidate division Kazan bacterium RIFCSPLOWO2_01_FULL_45_19 TaxID=1798538 RepID=A0A1F4NPU1_UNCK3|nr:hypothetical protein [uncultured bacterium]OGB73386.1 MAG: hypothetical protein A3K51_00715 [candidate division Kazan bacterium RIFCSPLOWO2_01_FULL_45_19]OGB77631.1 MAG: hypothetical protein A3K24_00715 [candidate division Kazan bacterium RIFCSPHIGHO2_01_FULL_44_14]